MGNAVARTTITAKLIRNVGNGALAGSIGGLTVPTRWEPSRNQPALAALAARYSVISFSSTCQT